MPLASAHARQCEVERSSRAIFTAVLPIWSLDQSQSDRISRWINRTAQENVRCKVQMTITIE